MRIAEIRIEQKKNLGNYESRMLGFTAVIGEDENPVESIDRIKKLLDWEINKEERDANYAKYQRRLNEIAELDALDQADDKISAEHNRLAKWVATYEATRTEMAAWQ